MHLRCIRNTFSVVGCAARLLKPNHQVVLTACFQQPSAYDTSFCRCDGSLWTHYHGLSGSSRPQIPTIHTGTSWYCRRVGICAVLAFSGFHI